jgi:hypothetical protein
MNTLITGITGKEFGKNGTPHLQGCAELNKQMRFKAIKREISNEMHFKRRFGSQKEAIDCCKNDGSFVEVGSRRTDLRKIQELIKTGVSQRELHETYDITASQLRVIDKCYTLFTPQRNQKTEVSWIYGLTGIGNSELAKKLGGPNCYWKENDTKWWDGYDNEEVVIIDEFRPTKYFSIKKLLGLFDKFPMKIEYKSGTKEFVSKKIIITTPKPPNRTFDNEEREDIQQLIRRIEHVLMSQDQELGNTTPTLDDPFKPDQRLLHT